MTTRDIKSDIAPVPSLGPAVLAAATSGEGVDLRGFDAAAIVLSVGAITGATGPTATFIVQESADDDDEDPYTTVDPADLDGALPTIAAANDDATYVVGYRGRKRWIRVRLDALTGTSDPDIPAVATVVRAYAHAQPAG